MQRPEGIDHFLALIYTMRKLKLRAKYGFMGVYVARMIRSRRK